MKLAVISMAIVFTLFDVVVTTERCVVNASDQLFSSKNVE